MRYRPLPSYCSVSYASKWPTGVPYTHDQLTRHRRGKYWKQIVYVPPSSDDESDEPKATVTYQYAEYQHGYSVGLAGVCEDAEWYIGWLVYHARGLNMANGWLTGYIHGKHFREHGVKCEAEVAMRKRYKKLLPPTKGPSRIDSRGFVRLASFADVKPTPKAKPKKVHHSFASVAIEALLECV